MFLIPKDSWEIRTTAKKGRGIFALKDIGAGVVIGDYLGKVILESEEEKYEKKHGFYSMWYHNDVSIFPDPKKPGIHLVNHSCAPNCWMYTYKGHTLYSAIRKIFKGEELTISYLIGPQDDECKPCSDICRCESDFCAQTMHMPEKYYNAWIAYDDNREKKSKGKRVKLNTQLPHLKSYPKSIRDNQLYILIGNEKKKPGIYSDKKLPSVLEIRARIRETGKPLHFNKLNLTVYGVTNNLLISKAN